jgi:glucose/arabinose dehydrogenase
LAIDSNVLDGVVAIPFMDPTKIFFQEVASGLNNPVFITNAGDGSGRMFVVERGGRIRIIKNGSLLATPYLDIQSLVKSTDSEQGLLGLAFHPAYGSNGKFYVVYTAPRTGDSNGSVLTLRQYSVSVGNPDIANPNGSTIVLTIDHPTYSNHNGGTITFGNDGYLYWSTGDGGSGGDPNNNGQNLNSLLGKILRIDMNSTSPYGIPPSNPFYSSSNPNIKKEIWSYGLRNPWRISFDRVTHDLYIGDVGQSAREEIDFQASSSTGGENYGWRVMEGSLCYNPGSGCDQIGKVLPVAEYDHSLGCSITGGYMYRGSDYPTLYGHYLYGDYCSGRLFSLRNIPGSGWESVQLLDTPYNISTFGEDEQGGLYLADYATGKIYNVGYMEEGFLYSNRKTANFGGQLYYIKSDPIRTTLTNYQATDVHMGSFIRSSGQFLLSNNTCAGATLTSGQSCTFDLQFKPTAYGALSGTLTINSDASNSPIIISLAGTGLSGTQLVNKGGSFEQDNDNNGIPDFWNTSGLTAPDSQSNQYAKHGIYSMKIVGQSGVTKTLKKTIMKNGSAGDDFLYVMWSRAQNVPGGIKYRTQVSFYNGTTLVERRIKDYTSGTHDWEYRWLPITVSGDYTRIEVEIIYSLASGTAWFDSNSLKWAP